MKNNYFLPHGYVPNEVNVTLDAVSGAEYWDKSRIYKSKYYQHSIYKKVKNILSGIKAKKIVDIGCGPGTKLVSLNKSYPHLEIFGVDQASAISYCKSQYDFGNWLTDDIENPQNLEHLRGVDLIISSDVIEHLLKPESLLEYIKKIAGKGTLVLLSTPDREKLRGKDSLNSPNPVHVREWTSGEFKEFLEFNGFEVVSQENHLPVKIALNRIFFSEVISLLIKGRNPFYNQCVLCRLK